MSDLRVSNLKGRTAGSAPNLPDGAVVTGICSATDFSGITNSPADFPNGITGVAATFTGNVTVGGTITYDDVQRIDSVGIVTAGGGLNVGRTEGTGTGIAVTVTTDGNAIFGKTGVVTATTFVGNLTGDPTGTVQTAAQPNITSVGTLTNLVATASSVTGISSVGLAITMYGSSGIVSATAFYGDGSQLEGVSASGSSLDITSCLFI